MPYWIRVSKKVMIRPTTTETQSTAIDCFTVSFRSDQAIFLNSVLTLFQKLSFFASFFAESAITCLLFP